MTSPEAKPAPAEPTRARLMYESPAVFMSELRDERGEPLAVERFHQRWLDLCQQHGHVCILAPRGHGKTTVVTAFLLWNLWRHNRHPDTGRLLAGLPEGRWEAIVFSATMEQAGHLFEAFQSLLLANEALFADVLPASAAGGRATIKGIWSRRRTRLRNHAEVSIRAYGTSTRGLHPHLILLDDALSDENSGNSDQRAKTWRYFTGTIMPMAASKLIVIGTAFAYDDLLHRLKPKEAAPGSVARSRVRFAWHRDPAINTEMETALWEARHSYAELIERREFDPVSFSREYMNEPVDDASSIFPFELTARMVDADATSPPEFLLSTCSTHSTA